jgi:hypothetical protein
VKRNREAHSDKAVYRDQLITGKLVVGMVIGLLLIVTLIVNILLFTLCPEYSPMQMRSAGWLRLSSPLCIYDGHPCHTLFVSIKTSDRTFAF